MRIKLYEKLATSPCKIGGVVNVYIRIHLVLSLRHAFWFVVSVPNKSFSCRNPFTALIGALESETIAAGKYVRLKESMRVQE